MKNQVICGDCKEVLRRFPPNTFDTIITDPPYGLGFMGKEWDHGVPGSVFWQICLRVAKPGAMMLVFGGTRTFHRLTCAIEDAGWEIRDCMMWLYGSGFPKSLDISKAIEKAKGVKPIKKIPAYGQIASRELIDNRGWNNINNALIMPPTQTDLAKLWDGRGTALKPAWEPIIVAMKPLDGTFAHNAETWGVAGLNIDGGRIGTGQQSKLMKVSGKGKYGQTYQWSNAERNGEGWQPGQGRWPANLILDEESAEMLGTPARFFYTAKASKKERNIGLDGKGQIVDDGRQKKIDNPYLRGETLRQNTHPTVKPLALMEYLCKLTKTPTGGLVLDPFGGSGTTALACIKTGRDYILIEKEPEYCEIANKRIGGLNGGVDAVESSN